MAHRDRPVGFAPMSRPIGRELKLMTEKTRHLIQDPVKRREALEKASRMRRERGQLRVALKSGAADPLEILCRKDDIAGRMRLYSFLTACPGIGAARARTLIRAIGTTESRRLAGLGSRQRAKLESALRLALSGAPDSRVIEEVGKL